MLSKEERYNREDIHSIHSIFAIWSLGLLKRLSTDLSKLQLKHKLGNFETSTAILTKKLSELKSITIQFILSSMNQCYHKTFKKCIENNKENCP